MSAPLIEWHEAYSLGVPSVDHEHRELVDLINELHVEIYRPSAETSVLDFLGELYARIGAHFALEERLMREAGYDEMIDHKRDHERLLDEIRDLMDDYERGRYVDVDAFGLSLERWFSGHFATHDARLHHRLG